MTRPPNIGIKALQIYFPNQCVEQAELEQFDGVSTGKYTIGLGQVKMGFCNDREDIYSMALTTLSSLLRDYKIDPMSVGRLEVGTETLLDKSKSVKTVLMQLFAGNTNIEGVDTINACYGGTNALLNSLNWIESSAWDGRDAIVVAGDIAIYPEGAARPTGGAGCVAMLIGPHAPIVVEPGLRGSYMAHTYDFYKADLKSEYALVDGHYSIQCYLTALDQCYKAYKLRQQHVEQSSGRNALETSRSVATGLTNGHTNGYTNGHTNGHAASPNNGHCEERTNGYTNGYSNGHYEDGIENTQSHWMNGHCKNKFVADGEDGHTPLAKTLPLDQFDFMCFHSPTTKIVAKSYARLLYNDYLAEPDNDLFQDVSAELRHLSISESLKSKAVEKTFSALSAKRVASRVQPSMLVGAMCGNVYTASVYGSLISLICNNASERLLGKRAGLFSFGSGLASTMFSVRFEDDTRFMVDKIDLHNRLNRRETLSPEEFVAACDLREKAHLQRDFTPTGSLEHILPGTYYLTAVDGMFRRTYQIKQ